MINDPMFLNFDEWCINLSRYLKKDLGEMNADLVDYVSALYTCGNTPEEAAKILNENDA